MKHFRSSSSSSVRFRHNHSGTRQRMLGGPRPTAVGTEALALQHLEQNRTTFQYPEHGFVTPIEYSLLYSTLARQPLVILPDAALETMIADEDFHQYLAIRTDRRHERIGTNSSNSNSNSMGTSSTVAATTTDPSCSSPHSPNTTSYAQLSALLALAAETCPPDSPIPKTLCKRLLQCVVQFSTAQGLDRAAEVQELLQPLERLQERRANRNALATLLPMYVGLGAAMVTMNPALLWAGYAIGNYVNIKAAVQDGNRQKKMQSIVTESNRASDVEQASLLDEVEDVVETEEQVAIR